MMLYRKMDPETVQSSTFNIFVIIKELFRSNSMFCIFGEHNLPKLLISARDKKKLLNHNYTDNKSNQPFGNDKFKEWLPRVVIFRDRTCSENYMNL